jgi:DHA1 family bicyclomycin/chloramphenicol resistance-like MFS transporter
MPAIQTTFAATTGGVQLLVSLSFFVFGFAMLFYGPIADGHGRRPVYFAGMAIYTLGNLLCAVAPSLPLLIAGRTIASAGSSVSMVLPRAIIRDLFAGHETAQVLARIAVVTAFAPMIAPPIGGVISDMFGWRALFALLAVVGVISCVLIYFLLPETLREPGRSFGPAMMLSSFGTLLRDRVYTAYALNGAFVASIFFVYMTAAPFVYITLLGLTATQYALYYMLTIGGFLIGYAVASRIAGRVPIANALKYASVLACGAALLAVMLAMVLPWTAWTLTLPVILVTVGSGINSPNSQAAVVSGDPRTIGAASGLAGFSQMMVGALLIQFVGMLPHNTPYPMLGTMLFTSIIGVATIVWGARIAARA